ncbi:HAD-like domain-containing protein [Blastocladiella britannica]|nr:HAD-like domain-containing protein [Blastocladiella britannica]
MICHQLTLAGSVAASLAGRSVKGIVFDMDGTLTVPVLDFALMKSRLGLLPHHDIVAEMHAMPPAQRAEAERIVTEMELEGMLAMSMAPAFHTLMTALERTGIPKAILTRNNMDPVTHMLTHHANEYSFHPIVTRDTVRPTKPHPDPLIHISKIWNLPPSDMLMVGDGADDIQCAQSAGALACFVHTPVNAAHRDRITPEMEIHSLEELLAALVHEDGAPLQ